MVKSLVEVAGKFRGQPLSDTPSVALRQVVNDIRWALRRPDVRLNMDGWVSPSPGRQRCDVCVAGAVMLRRAGFEPLPSQLSGANGVTAARMRGLDSLRRGYIGAFLAAWDVRLSQRVWRAWRAWCPAASAPAWYYGGKVSAEAAEQMCRNFLLLAADLEKAGF